MTPLRLQDSPLSSGRIGELGSKKAVWSSFSVSLAVHGALLVAAVAIVPVRRAIGPETQHVDGGIEVYLVPGPPPPLPLVGEQLPEQPGVLPSVGTPAIVQPNMD